MFSITFSIPAEKISSSIHHPKTKLISDLIPGDHSTYIYNTEEEYYNEYKSSYFAITKKKGGWDCLRHYEILANGCIPVFESLEKCPKQTLSLLPKTLLHEGNNLFEKLKHKNITQLTEQDKRECDDLSNQLLEYTKQKLSTTKLAEYVLLKSNSNKDKKVLYLSYDTSPDYLGCLTLHGLKTIFGENIHDFPKIPYIYKTDTIDYSKLYGRGMTYTNLLDATFRNDKLDDQLIELINEKYFDLIIYGSYHRGMILTDHILHLFLFKTPILKAKK